MNDLHPFIFGELRLMPRDYYEMLPVHFYSLIEGYSKYQYRLSNELRFSTFINLLPWVKDVTYPHFCRDFWPLEMDNIKAEPAHLDPMPDAETWQQLKKQMKPRKTEYEMILSKHNLTGNQQRETGN